jgi:AAA domain (dynein-related subfamily)
MNPIPTPQNNNMMDMMKSQLMTVMMMKSMNNNGEKGSGDNSMFTMLYVFILTGLIDFICKTVAPSVINQCKEYYKNKMKNTTDLLQNMTTSKDSIKSSSITIQIKISDHENIYGQALLDYITNNNNTKHITYKKQNFILNQKDTIEITDDLFINLKENKMSEAANDKSPADLEQTIELFSYKKTTHELRTFLNKLSYDYELKMKNKLGDHIYYFNQHPTNIPADSNGNKDLSKLPSTTIFTMKKFQTNRKFSNLFGPEIDIVKKRVEFFIKNKKWYDEKGIPYTIGLLLSGQAGAGKTSSVKCLANETNRHIININLNNDITKTQFENLFFNEVISVLNTSTGQTEKYSIPLDQRIYVLEDIDCQSDLVMERSLKKPLEKKEEQQPTSIQSVKTNPNKPDTYNNPVQTGCEKLDLSHLLNVLDGVLEIPGRIVIMTSNYIDKLDHALIRPGRIDIIANFKKCVNKTLIEMMEFFYDLSLTEKDKKRILALKEYIVSPAEMGKVMFENFDDFRNAIDTLDKICEETERKEQKNIIYTPVIEETEKKDVIEETEKKDVIEETEKKDVIEETEKKDVIEEIEKKDVIEEIEKKDVNEETEKKEEKSIIYTPPKRKYSIPSTNKAYGENDSLEIFDPTQVFSSRVSVF